MNLPLNLSHWLLPKTITSSQSFTGKKYHMGPYYSSIHKNLGILHLKNLPYLSISKTLNIQHKNISSVASPTVYSGHLIQHLVKYIPDFPMIT